MDKNIALVKQGYVKAARPYYEIKDKSQHRIQIFQKWLQDENNDHILELGCGSGFPIGEAILKSGKRYTGIDLSEVQIELAHELYPQWNAHFRVAEMVEFCRNAPDGTYTGIVSMFSIRHLPRMYHAELYCHLYRMLTPGGKLLIDITGNSDDAFVDKWLGDSIMYWSGFSSEWTRLTLGEIGFKIIEEEIDEKKFGDDLERTLFVRLGK
jgi:cyclopropane fatty-acyl-phospholipid synthase-like methyltransferase